MRDGYLSPCPYRKWGGLAIDTLQCSGWILSKFETTPFARFDGTNAMPVKMFKNRGAYYMGSTDQNTVWNP
jgi:hypothetical protein